MVALMTSAKEPEAESPPRPVGRGDHVFLVDGSSFVFRAYFQSIRQDPKYNYRSDRLPTGAVRLFCTKLFQFINEGAAGIMPTHLAIIFDKSENSFRKDLYPAYKSNRSEPPEDLIPQFPLMRDSVRAFGLTPVEQDIYEADDLIATYAEQAVARGADVLIISADKDLMQLIRPGVAMYDPASGTAGAAGSREERKIGEQEVFDYFGVGPELVVDVQALAGDATDNVPGAKGIGIKTAAQLITEYGDLDTLLQCAREIKQPKKRETLTDAESVKLIRLSKALVSLKRDVAVEVPLDALGLMPPDGRTLVAYFKALEFSTLTRRAAESFEVEAGEIEPDPAFAGQAGWRNRKGEPIAGETKPFDGPARNARYGEQAPVAPIETGPGALATARAKRHQGTGFDLSRYLTITSLEALDAFIEIAAEAGHVAVDTETSALDPLTAELIGISLCVGPGDAVYVPMLHVGEGGGDLFGGAAIVEGQLAPDAVLAKLKPLLEDPSVLKIAHNMKYDWHIFARRGIIVAPTDDTLLLSYVLDAGRTDHGMDVLSEKLLGHKPIPFGQVAGQGRTFIGFSRVAIAKATEYAAEDTDVTLRLWEVLRPRLPAEHMSGVYETLERPMTAVLGRMERRGIRIDKRILAKLSGEFALEAARLEVEIFEMAGSSFNIGSPKQLGDILFGRMGLPGARKTATGAWSTAAGRAGGFGGTGQSVRRQGLGVAPDHQAQEQLLRRAADLRRRRAAHPHLLHAGRDDDGPPVIHRTEPAEHPRAQRGRPQDPHRLRGDARTRAAVGRLFADRAAPARAYRRHPAAEGRVLEGPRHPCDDGVGNVFRTDGGHDERDPPPRQGDQLRHHLRHLGLRPRQPARHRARRGRRLHQALFRALPRHPRLHGLDQGHLPHQGLRRDPVRPALPLSTHHRVESVRARL